MIKIDPHVLSQRLEAQVPSGDGQQLANGTVSWLDVNLDGELPGYCVDQLVEKKASVLAEHPELNGLSEDELRSRLAQIYEEEVIEAIDEVSAKSETLIDLFWSSLASSSWSVEKMDLGGVSFICLPRDLDVGRPWSLVAAVRPKDSPEGIASVVEGLLRDNEVIGSMPSTITNCAPDLIPRSVVKRGLIEQMKWRRESMDDFIREYAPAGIPEDQAWDAALDAYMEEAYSEKS